GPLRRLALPGGRDARSPARGAPLGDAQRAAMKRMQPKNNSPHTRASGTGAASLPLCRTHTTFRGARTPGGRGRDAFQGAMRRLDFHRPLTRRTLDRIAFKSLYSKEIYDAPTRDGWVLRISRYKPVEQPWDQPIFGQPMLLVPGWSQNRHAFTCGDFVKQLLAYGTDIHIVEL